MYCWEITIYRWAYWKIYLGEKNENKENNMSIMDKIKFYEYGNSKIYAELLISSEKNFTLNGSYDESKKEEYKTELKKDIHNQIYSDFLLQDLTEAEIILGQLYQLIPVRKETKEQESALVVQKREMLKNVYQKLADKIQVMYVKVKGSY